jgi:wingless-type MMTV integration site family protein 1
MPANCYDSFSSPHVLRMWVFVTRVRLSLLTSYMHVKDGRANLNIPDGHGCCFRGIAKAGEPNNLLPQTPGALYMDPAVHLILRRKQRRLVRENPGVLVAVAKGANQAIQECQFQFRNRRWNCSTRNFLRGKNLFGKIVDRGKFLFF